jgi:hypothetical protein
MRGIDGYIFAPNAPITPEQRKILDDAIAVSPEKMGAGIKWVKEGKGTYFSAYMPNSLHIWGIGKREEIDKQVGTIWGHNDKDLLEYLYNAKISEFYPFNVFVGEVYVADVDGQVYISNYKKGKKVITPKGKGTIWSVDECVSVELDDDSSVIYEFDLLDVEIYKSTH